MTYHRRMAVPAFVAVESARNGGPEGTTSLAIDVPSGSDGDLLVAVLGVKENPSTVTPSGWTSIIAGFNQCTSGIDPGAGIRAQLSTWWRVADGSESTVTFTWGNQVINQAAGAILRYSGADATEPIDASGCDKGTSTSPTAPSVTTTSADTRVVRVVVADADQAKSLFSSEPATKRFELASTSVFGPGSSYTTDAVVTAGSDEERAAAGATGTAAWALPSADQWAAQTVAIKPAAAGGGTGSGEGCVAIILAIIKRILRILGSLLRKVLGGAKRGATAGVRKGSATIKERRAKRREQRG